MGDSDMEALALQIGEIERVLEQEAAAMQAERSRESTELRRNIEIIGQAQRNIDQLMHRGNGAGPNRFTSTGGLQGSCIASTRIGSTATGQLSYVVARGDSQVVTSSGISSRSVS